MEIFSILEIKSVYNSPFVLDFIDDINCPICDIEIDIKDIEIHDSSSIYCEDCKHTINFKTVIV